MANVIIKQVFGDVLQCFTGGVSVIQVANNVLAPQFFEINFSNFTVGLPYLLPSLTFCYSEIQPPPVDPFFSGVTRYWEDTVKMFLSTHDPSHLMQFHRHFDFVTPPTTDLGIITIPLQCTLISTKDAPHCLSSKLTESTVIIDTGASVCISPHQTDFVTYGDSAMKIKDLSSSN